MPLRFAMLTVNGFADGILTQLAIFSPGYDRLKGETHFPVF